MSPDEVARLERLLREAKTAADERERDLLLAMVSIMDGFERLQDATREEAVSQDAQRLFERFHRLGRRLEATLERQGVRRVEALGEPADRDWLEVVAVRPAEQGPAGIVIEVEENGWRKGGDLLRPARVVVTQ